MKVNYFIDNLQLSNFNFDRVDEGNPGVGGTEFVTIKIAKLLADVGIKTIIQSPVSIFTPSTVGYEKVESVHKAIALSHYRTELLILRLYVSDHKKIFNSLKKYPKSKIVFWLHLTPTQEIITELGQLEQVIAFICVESNQRNRLIDYENHFKLVTIPHPIDRNINSNRSDTAQDVCFLGSLVPQKGFHLLADVWSKVNSKYPNSNLYVIGSSALYGKLGGEGNFSVAEKTYEERIFRVLSPRDNSVVFMGNLNKEEREKVFKKCLVGVVNPSGATETFCLSAVELQSYGIPVVSANKFGLKDTIVNKETGLLTRNRFQLRRAILKILRDDKLRARMSTNAVRHVTSKYDIGKVTTLWLTLLRTIELGSKTQFPRDLSRINPKSLRAIVGSINRYVRIISRGRWPMLIQWGGYFRNSLMLLRIKKIL
jgi:glycosyltransferase involved in cell wall biosynthesis